MHPVSLFHNLGASASGIRRRLTIQLTRIEEIRSKRRICHPRPHCNVDPTRIQHIVLPISLVSNAKNFRDSKFALIPQALAPMLDYGFGAFIPRLNWFSRFNHRALQYLEDTNHDAILFAKKLAELWIADVGSPPINDYPDNDTRFLGTGTVLEKSPACGSLHRLNPPQICC